MIIYATRQTFECYGLKLVDQLSELVSQIARAVIVRESGDALREWGMKLFYFNRKKCLQIVNFATKFTLFTFDIKKEAIGDMGSLLACYLLELYKQDSEMVSCLKRMFAEEQVVAFAPLKDKRIIATLNHNQLDFAFDGERFWDYVDKNGILHSMKINHDFNFGYLVSHQVNGRSMSMQGNCSENRCWSATGNEGKQKKRLDDCQALLSG